MEEIVKQKAIAASVAKQRMDNIGLRNIPSDPLKAVELNVEYQLAKDLWLEAQREYERAFQEWRQG
jgi:hypothetical protein